MTKKIPVKTSTVLFFCTEKKRVLPIIKNFLKNYIVIEIRNTNKNFHQGTNMNLLLFCITRSFQNQPNCTMSTGSKVKYIEDISQIN